MPEDKSILDTMPVVCSVCGKSPGEHQGGFPCGIGGTLGRIIPKDGSSSAPPKRKLPQEKLGVVSYCPKCGNPIYGKSTKLQGEDAQIERSCGCAVTVDPLAMQTK